MPYLVSLVRRDRMTLIALLVRQVETKIDRDYNYGTASSTVFVTDSTIILTAISK